EGNGLPVNYADYGLHLYDEGKKSMDGWARDYLTRSIQARPHAQSDGSALPTDPIPDLYKDSAFGHAAKYYVAWDGVTDAILSDGAFFSLPHVIELRSELDCAMLLATHLYYKQALQVVRGFLEMSVAELFLCANPTDFKKWKKGTWKAP